MLWNHPWDFALGQADLDKPCSVEFDIDFDDTENPLLGQYERDPEDGTMYVELRAGWDWYLVGKLNTEPPLRPPLLQVHLPRGL